MNTVKKIPAGFHAITPYLNIKNAPGAIEFYQRAFGAKEIGRISLPDGTIAHAELEIEGNKIMLAEEFPDWKNTSPTTLGGTSFGIALYVADADAAYQRAIAAGAQVNRPLEDQFYGDRSGSVIDPFGHRWYIQTHIEDVSFAEMQKRCDAMFTARI